MPIQRVRRSTTSTEFNKWQRYFRQELNTLDRTIEYLKLIAVEVRRTRLKDPSKVKLQDMALKFESRKVPTSSTAAVVGPAAADLEDEIDQQRQDQVTAQKSFWNVLLGSGKKKRKDGVNVVSQSNRKPSS